MTKLNTTRLNELPIKTILDDDDYVVISGRGTKKIKAKDITKDVEMKAADLEEKTKELGSQLDNIANKGTTVEVVENTTRKVINEFITDGTIANMTIEDKSISSDKLADKSVTADKISSDIFKNVYNASYNLFDLNSYEIGKFDAYGGISTNETDKIVSDYIEIDNTDTYVLEIGTTNVSLFSALYDSEKRFVKSLFLNKGDNLNRFDSNIKFIRIGNILSNLNSCMFYKGEYEKGLEYKPYMKTIDLVGNIKLSNENLTNVKLEKENLNFNVADTQLVKGLINNNAFDTFTVNNRENGYCLNTVNTKIKSIVLKPKEDIFNTDSLNVCLSNYNLSKKHKSLIKFDKSRSIYFERPNYDKSTNSEYVSFDYYDENLSKISNAIIGDNVKTYTVNKNNVPVNAKYIDFTHGAFTDNNRFKYMISQFYGIKNINVHTLEIKSNDNIKLRKVGEIYDELDLQTGKLTQRISDTGTILDIEVEKYINLKYYLNDQEFPYIIVPKNMMYYYTIGKCVLDMEVPIYSKNIPNKQCFVTNKLTQYEDFTIEYGRGLESGTDFTIFTIPKKTIDGTEYKLKVNVTNAKNECEEKVSNYSNITNYMKNIDENCVIGLNAGIFDMINFNYPNGVTISDGVAKTTKIGGNAINDDGSDRSHILTCNADGILGYEKLTEDAESLIAKGIKNTTVGWTNIIDDGIINYDGIFMNGNNFETHPRQVIGQFKNGDYIIFSCDGRDSDNTGMDMLEICNILLTKGIQFAFNLDGGGSTNLSLRNSKSEVVRISPDVNENRVVPVGIFFYKS